MDTVQSFKGYDKVDELEASAFRKKLRRRLIFLCITLVVLVSLIAAIVTGVLVHKRNSSSQADSPSSAIQTVCSVTPYPDSCVASLSSSKLSNPEKLFQYSLTVAMSALEKVTDLPDEYAKKSNDPLVQEAGRVCTQVLNDAVDFLNDTISSHDEGSTAASKISDLRTWLSTVLTDQETCFDALEEANATFVGEIRSLLRTSTELATNSLAIVSKLLGLLADFKIPFGGRRRRLMAEESESEPGDFPAWVSLADRRILLDKGALKADVTVSKTGTVKSLTAALGLIPPKSKKRFVILVKEGRFEENVEFKKSHQNVVLLGMGTKKTIISAGLNFVDGTPTFRTATVAVTGQLFMARGITFENTAGAAKHQAVALRSGSDLSIFYQCKFVGFQDTLYTHSNRQFYLECIIVGTIDFIFGNAAVVFQRCDILARNPMLNQYNTITAQGKKDPGQNTGMSIHNCNISAFDNITGAQTYLGRPWKDFSTTVIRQSHISPIVNALGWISWITDVDPPTTVMYREYGNTGAGAELSGRVKWAKSSLSKGDASKFKVGPFINGLSWIKAAGLTYDPN